jgi:YidC/Oxa1 family membrane protein insertase
MGQLWNSLLINPILNVLIVFYKLSEFLHLPGPLGFSIIFMTAFMRLILYPLTNAQLKSAKRMNELKPKLDELSHKHKDDKTALQQAQMALYKEHGINPAAGCLPMLIQFPVLIALYNVFYQFFGISDVAKHVQLINKVLYLPSLHISTIDFSFFGLSLSLKPNQWQSHGWWLLAIPLLTALLQWYQTRLMLPATPKKPAAADLKATGKEAEKKPDDMAEMQKQMAIMTPLMFGFFSYSLPIGLALYWNLSGIFAIMQQLKINNSRT